MKKRRKSQFRWRSELTPVEGRIWRVLNLACSDAIEYQELIRRVFGHEFFAIGYDPLRTHISNLKAKGYNIQCVYQFGYRLISNPNKNAL